jgi:hypothetical protein
MSEVKFEKPLGDRKGIAEAFENGRKFHVGIGIITLLSSFAMLLYLASCMSGMLTSTLVDPAMVLMPALWLGACIAIAWGLSAYRMIKSSLRGNYLQRKIVKVSGIIGAGVAIAMIVGLLTLVLNDADAVTFRNVSIYFIVANFVMLGASWAGLYSASELRDPEAPKETRTAEELNTPMPVKVVFRRAFSYCARHYGALLVLFFGFSVIGRVLYSVFLSSWHASLLNEEQFLITWLTQNNYIPGMDVPGDIYSSAQLLYNVQNVFVYFQDVFKSSFYYAALGIGITIVMKSYEGSNSRLSEAMRNARGKIGPLIIVSVLFSLCYQLGLVFLFVPGLLVYAYCIFAFPNLLYVGKYKTLQNFGEAKNRISGNFTRAIVFTAIIYFIQFGFQLVLQLLLDGVVQGFGGAAVIKEWRMDPFGNLGNIMLLESITGSLITFIAPIETALLAMLFFDLAARKRAKVVAGMKSPSARGSNAKSAILPAMRAIRPQGHRSLPELQGRGAPRGTVMVGS